MTRVSLIIPTFNRPHLLPRCLRSAREAGTDVEIIIVDDASTDGTAAVCKSFAEVKYVRLERNQGVAGARNIGLLAASSDYVGFLDDDDLRLPGSLDHQLALIESTPEAGLVAGAALLGDQDCNPTGEVAIPRAQSGDIFWQVLELGVLLLPSSVLVRKDCFREVGIFNSSISGIDDWDMWTRIAATRPILIDDRPVCIYRSATPHSGQGSSGQARHLQAAIKHQDQLLTLPRVREAPAQTHRRVRRNTRRRIADTLSWRAAEQLPRGALGFAAENFMVALRLSPLHAARPTHLRVLWRASVAQLRANKKSDR